MDITCTSCDHINVIGTVFCKSCGDKISDNALRKAVAKRDKADVTSNLRGIASNLMFFGVILGIPAAALLPVGHPAIELVAEGDHSKTMHSYSLLKKKINGGATKKIGATHDKINTIIAAIIKRQQKQSAISLELSQLGLKVNGAKDITIQAKTKLFGVIPAYVEIHGTPLVVDGNLEMEYSSAKLGHLPLPGLLAPFIGDELKSDLEEFPEINRVMAEVKRIGVTSEKFTLALHKNVVHNPKIGLTKLLLASEQRGSVSSASTRSTLTANDKIMTSDSSERTTLSFGGQTLSTEDLQKAQDQINKLLN